jgi:hypothetical protein
MTFRATVELNGRTATGIEVPDEVVEGLGAGRRPAVWVTLGAHTYRTTVAARGGRFLIPLSAENREAAGVAAGDVVDVEILVDHAPREVDVPAALTEALDSVPGARERFDALNFTRRKEMARSVAEAKKPETRQRRVEKALAELT